MSRSGEDIVPLIIAMSIELGHRRDEHADTDAETSAKESRRTQRPLGTSTIPILRRSLRSMEKQSAVLLIDCPDRPGLVARVSSLLYEQGANILHADQHQDHELGLFFMRVEWGLILPGKAGREAELGVGFTGVSAPDGGKRTSSSSYAQFDLAAFERVFAPLAEELEMRWTLASSARRPRVALFCSQYLHCMADLLDRWHT